VLKTAETHLVHKTDAGGQKRDDSRRRLRKKARKLQKEVQEKPMKFAYSTSIFKMRPLKDAVDCVAKAGFEAVELMADRPHVFPQDFKASEISTLHECLERRKLKVIGLGAGRVSALGDGHHPSWIEEDWKERELRIRYTLDCLRLAAALGVPSISIFPGGKIPQSMNQGEAWRLFVADLHRVLPLARKLAVRVLVEPTPEMLVENSEQMLALLKEFDGDEALGVNFGTADLAFAGEDPCEAWDRLKPYAGQIHLGDLVEGSDHRHTQLGEGVLDIPRFLRSVLASGYEGYVTVEMESADRDAEELVLGSAVYLRKEGFLHGESGQAA
jgi:sugar phosphate isomerase/epimerase